MKKKKPANEGNKRRGKESIRINVNNGVAINHGNVVIHNYAKRQKVKVKVNHTDGSKSWQINSLEDLLDAWRQYLSACSHKHEYCLEKYHIIQYGYSIKCNPDIPDELYSQFGLSDNCTIESPFIRCSTYSNKIINYMTTKTWNEVELAVIGSLNEKEGLVKDQVRFVEEYFRFCLLLFKKNDLYKRLNKSEFNFSRLLVWPSVEVSVDSVEGLEFLPGEYALKSTNEKYNADGCVVDEDDNEMFLLETSGKLKLNEKWKYGYDHVKCTFGALSIYNAAFKKYFFATEKTALKHQVSYIHAITMADLMFVMNLERSRSSLIAMKQEHGQHEVQRMPGGTESRTSLVEMVNLDIQKPVKGDRYVILLPEEKDERNCSVKFVDIKDEK
ncbi:hypothetical protein INT47_012604 [Mucor saturninus]|uniref:Uncharacterized protein n=1 Tax=Mucor saturninus TaxID=64648 RepID=A0A8H7V296_9FUNG|nr:hypothetical protein INT47_012604 [Mucor saturninus]